MMTNLSPTNFLKEELWPPQFKSWMMDSWMISANSANFMPTRASSSMVDSLGGSSPCGESTKTVFSSGHLSSQLRNEGPSGKLSVNKNKSRRNEQRSSLTKTRDKNNRKKTPPHSPWTKLQHESPPVNARPNSCKTDISNPFKRELFISQMSHDSSDPLKEPNASNAEPSHSNLLEDGPLDDKISSFEYRTGREIPQDSDLPTAFESLVENLHLRKIIQEDLNILGLYMDNSPAKLSGCPLDCEEDYPRLQSAEIHPNQETQNQRLYRLNSICDSGIGLQDDNSMSVGSLSTLSDEETLSESSCALTKEVLCGNRVSQMTHTYHDIEAVTRLLQEKEKDLELAARIGQQLLTRNRGLEERTSSLENEITSLNEQLTQVKHDLQMKTELLQIYTNDIDESSTENTPTSNKPINIDLLQHRIANLEDDNKRLHQEATQLACDTQACENHEKKLVHDVIKQLNDANLQVHQLSDELAKKVEDSLRQQEEITQLLAQVVDLQSAAKRLNLENEELTSMVGVARECQQELTTELAGLKEKYAEVLDLLHDTQEQLRRSQKKHLPGSRGMHLGASLFSSPFDSGNDSIASEFHSLTSSLTDGERPDSTRSLSRVFDTVRLSSRLSGIESLQSTPTKQANFGSFMSPHYQTIDSRTSGSFSPFCYSSSLNRRSESSGLPSLDSGADSDFSFNTDSEDNYPASQAGVPGWPGTPDLEKCLRRLGSNEQPFLPYGCNRAPDSIMSTGSGRSGTRSEWKLPQKLQIVKPIEGSLTLHQWSRLATPHLGGLLEEREGVAIKGATNADLNLELYSMSDLEEDEPCEARSEFPGKQFMYTSGINTYTNSTVLHPDDVTNLVSSLPHAQSSMLLTSSGSTAATPVHTSSLPPSRRGSTATFSTNIGLAKHLNERGFSNVSTDIPPTATPANSPEGSRSDSPEPIRYKIPGLDDLTKTFYTGANYLRRTFYRENPNIHTPAEGPKINLVEKVQAMGVDKFVGLSGSVQTVGSVVTSRPETTSPLLHLSNLIRSVGGNSRQARTTTNSTTNMDSPSVVDPGGIMATPKIVSPGSRRPNPPQGAPLGIPGRPGSNQLDSRLKQLKPGQRVDLGTVGRMNSRPLPPGLGQVPGKRPGTEERMGTVGWTSFGRKGGLL